MNWRHFSKFGNHHSVARPICDVIIFWLINTIFKLKHEVKEKGENRKYGQKRYVTKQIRIFKFGQKVTLFINCPGSSEIFSYCKITKLIWFCVQMRMLTTRHLPKMLPIAVLLLTNIISSQIMASAAVNTSNRQIPNFERADSLPTGTKCTLDTYEISKRAPIMKKILLTM